MHEALDTRADIDERAEVDDLADCAVIGLADRERGEQGVFGCLELFCGSRAVAHDDAAVGF